MPIAAESSYTPWKFKIFNTKNVLWLFLSLYNLLQEVTAPFFPFTWIHLDKPSYGQTFLVPLMALENDYQDKTLHHQICPII